jgi:hypothetical protein
MDGSKPAAAPAVAVSAPADASAAPVAAPEAAAAPPAPEKPSPRKFVRATAPSAPVEAPSASAKSTPAPEKGSRILARLRSQIEAQSAEVSEAKAYRAELAEYAKGALEGVSKEVRAYVAKLAGDNPAKQLAALRELKAAGLLGAPVAAPANTAPKAASPSGAKPGDDDASILAEYERLKKVAPYVALDYQHRNRDALQRARSRNN